MRSVQLVAFAIIAMLINADAIRAGDPASDGWPADWQTTVSRMASAPRHAKQVSGSVSRHKLDGIASYYWQGKKTASGEPFDKSGLTAAHPTLPFNSLVRVTDRDSGNSVVVRINDRGPFVPGRVIDLSEGAAEVIGMKRRGLTPVQLEVLSGP